LRAPPGADAAGANEAVAGDRADSGDHRFHVWGRSCVIHMLWNAFLFTGPLPHRQPATWFAGCGPA